ncbi:MAG: VOC family protein, partial [Pseudomonadota bacterium]
GLHHVTSMASDAQTNNHFFTKVLGLRRVKKTVNFDSPKVYHLYYGDSVGTPGTVMTYFPFPNIQRGERGSGEVGITNFSVPVDALKFWEQRFAAFELKDISTNEVFGEKRLYFKGPDGDDFALVETPNDRRIPWFAQDIPLELAIRGFHSTTLRLRKSEPVEELLKFMNYESDDSKDGVTRMTNSNKNGAHVLELEAEASMQLASQGGGSVHHIAFAVENREKQLEVRNALVDAGFAVTPVIDRDYFWAIYFKTPEGILFEVATNEPGFDRDESEADLGKALKLPTQHEHLREQLESYLQPIDSK